MLATGIDLIEIERVRRGLERYGARFANRFFTCLLYTSPSPRD